jgi:hypothetical protein
MSYRGVLFYSSPPSGIGELIRFWLSCLGFLVYCFQTFLYYLAFEYFDIERTR